MDLVGSTRDRRNDAQYFERANIGFQPVKFAVIRHQDTSDEDLRGSQILTAQSRELATLGSSSVCVWWPTG
jgi:hypothetical protein